MHESSPQSKQMAHESMVDTLAAQAEAIWPQELQILTRAAAPAHILDVGCGTGEISLRLAELFPAAQLIGVDLEPLNLDRARARCAGFGARVRFELADALALPFSGAATATAGASSAGAARSPAPPTQAFGTRASSATATSPLAPAEGFELVVCRHLLQALPDVPRAVAEMVRVTAHGGRLHVLAEDYGMLWCHPTPRDADAFWQRVPTAYGAAIGCDVHVGRKMFTLLHDAGLVDIRADYVVVDTLRVPRETFARIWQAWRDGYTEPLAEHSNTPREEIARWWDELIAAVRDERGYALWQVPIWTAQKP